MSDLKGKVFFSNSKRYLEGVARGVEHVGDSTLVVGEIESSDKKGYPFKLVIEDPELDELHEDHSFFDSPKRGIPHIEIDKICMEDLLKLGEEGFYFPKIQSAPAHESMIIDMQLLLLDCTDTDRESIIDLLIQHTDIPRKVLRWAPMIYVNWEV